MIDALDIAQSIMYAKQNTYEYRQSQETTGEGSVWPSNKK